VVLRFGDTLLVEGRRRDIGVLRDEHRNFVVVAEPRELREPVRNTQRAPVAIAIMVGMLLLMTFGVVANVTAVLMAAVAMVLFGCMTVTQGYRTINWESVVLIAAILPMATALDRTGGIRLIVDGLLGALGGAGPVVVLASLFVLTSLFSQVISNTATTVLVAPIAFRIATELGASPQVFLITVAIAASTAFATPIASPVNTLVLGPGNYRFADFLKVGIPMQLLIMVATLLVVPLMF
jgi:di/tricarboxylate transporter